VPFTFVHAAKYRTEKWTENTQIKYNTEKKQTTQNTAKQN